MKIKEIILITFILTLGNLSFGQNNKEKKNGLVPLSAVENKLYIKEVEGSRKVRLKKKETIELILDKDTIPFYAKVIFWDNKGLYFTPYSERCDSFPVDTISKKYYKYSFLAHDTIQYIEFNGIKQINFKKNLKSRTDFALIVLTTGVDLFVLPLILSPMLGGGYSNFGPEGFYIVGIGAVMTGYGWWRLKRLHKLNKYPMTKYEFMLK